MRHNTNGGGIPMEWIAAKQTIPTGASNTTATVLDLNLDDDEVAEIHQVESMIQIADPVDPAADRDVNAELALVMDPSYPVGAAPVPLPSAEAFYTDLENFYTHLFSTRSEFITAVGAQVMKTLDTQIVYYNYKPVLLATNPSMIVARDAESGAVYWVRLFFTRKKAGRDDLTRILLKRR